MEFRPTFKFPQLSASRRNCLVIILFGWAACSFLLQGLGAAYWATWMSVSSLDHPFILSGTDGKSDTLVAKGFGDNHTDIWKHLDGREALALSKDERQTSEVNLLPLEPLHEEFVAGRATVFLLRIQKAASSALDVMFSTHKDMDECQPNMRVLEDVEGERCNQLFALLHYAEYDPETCGGLTAWDDPAWESLDCIPWIFSYTYEESWNRLPTPIQARLRRAFQSSRLVSGHFSYGIHSIGHRGTFAYVTTLRHPVHRVVSWWNWSIQTGKLAPPVGESAFEDFVRDADFPVGGFQKSNHMTRVLCNQGTGLVSDLSEERLSEDTPLELLTEMTQEHYQCALRNLQNFALVFVSELISEVEPLAPLLSNLFHMRTTVAPLTNGTQSNPTILDESAGMVVRSKLSEATTAKLMELNKWDVLLYDKARTLHDVSVARLKQWGENAKVEYKGDYGFGLSKSRVYKP